MQLNLKKVLFILNLISHASANPSKEASKVIKNMEDCDITKAALEAIDFIEQLKNKSESETHIYHKASDRFFGTDALIDGGLVPGSTYMGPALSSVIEFLQLGKVTHEFENSVYGAATCNFCKAAFLFLQYYLDREIYMEEVIGDAKMFCKGLVMLKPSVCNGFVEGFGPEVFMVMKSTKQSPEHICGFMFGEACNNPESPQHEWSMAMPPPARKSVVSHVKKINKLVKRSAPKHTGHLKILHVTDTHWDPEYQEGSLANCQDFLCCRKTSGEVYDEDDRAGYWGDARKCDMPLRTIEAMYRNIRYNHPDIDWIYWTGDLPPHDIWMQTKEGNSDIVRGTARQLKKHFPGIPVYPALGNHESAPVDSFPPPNIDPNVISMSWLHDVLVQEWGQWLGQSHSWSVRKGAFYSINVSPGLRVISLNMNYCMKMNLWLLLNSTDPAEQLQWLVYELQLAELNNEKVHILGHVPPGNMDCVRVWSRNFNKIINRYAHIVTGQFYGHTHNDEFQIFYNDENYPTNIAYVAPSMTPYHGLNPSFRIYTVSVSGEMLDHETYNTDLIEANKHPDQDPPYNLLYSARTSYNLPDLSPVAWHNFVLRLQSDKSLFKKFYYNFNTGAESNPCDPVCRMRMLCRLVSARSHDSKSQCEHLEMKKDEKEEDGWWSWLGR